MKKFYFTILIMVGFALSCVAQSTYYPLVHEDEDQQWNVLHHTEPYHYTWETEIQYIEGDSIIDGIAYKQVWRKKSSDGTGLRIKGFVREESKRVYSRILSYYSGDWELGEEVLLYDFNLAVGDTVTTVGEAAITLIVIEESEVEVNGTMRRQLGLGGEPWPFGSVYEYWIEGVGSTYGFMNSGSETICGSSSHLLCYYENDNQIWDNEDYDSCVMNNYDPYLNLFAPIGTEWYYEIPNDNGSITYQYIECAADTTINDKPIHILVRINTLYDKEKYDVTTHEYIYEEYNKVYWWNKTLGEFTALYDFSAEVGDEWEIKVGTQTIQVHVDAAQTVIYNGQEYKMLSISDPDDIFTGDIICGIGHLTSFFPEKLMTKGYRVENIRCFWQDGELIYQNGDQDCDEIYEQHHLGVDEIDAENGFVIYPNPSHNVLFVKTCHGASLQSEYRITNIMGQTIMNGTINSENKQIDVSSLTNGIYFITFAGETQKFVVK